MLKKVKMMFLTVLMISSLGAAVAFAETTGNGANTTDTGTTQMQTTNNNDDDNNNWGWLGLLGLVGLLGLRRRDRDTRKVDKR